MNRNLIATVLIIAAIGIYFTITKSMIADAQAVKASNTQLTDALASADQITTLRDKVNTQYQEISEVDRARIDKMIPSAVDNIRLSIDLGNIALANHFSLSDVKASVPSTAGTPGRPAATTGYAGGAVGDPILDKVQVSFSAITSYEQFIQFMQNVEANLRVMDLTHLTVAANEDGTYTFNVQLQTYWLRQ